jgi:ketosteroid isomerase-like protein
MGAMKTLVAFALLTAACTAPTPAQAPQAQAQAQPQPAGASAVDAVKQVAQDMGTAMVASDVAWLDRIYADDFATVARSGELVTKKNLLTDFSSFHDKLLWFACGPIDVQVFGRFAVSQGTVQEKRVRDGKDTSGEFAWMDLLENRGGRWVVMRSASARLRGPDAPGQTAHDPAGVDELVRLTRHTGDAMVAFDVDELSRIYADDWVTVASNGDVVTKALLLDEFRTRKHRLLSFELAPMKVQVLGDVAMVQAHVHERRLHDGKDTSGEFVFMDLLERRAQRWVIVRTLGARVG